MIQRRGGVYLHPKIIILLAELEKLTIEQLGEDAPHQSGA